MKTLILGRLLLVILSSCIHPGFAITALDDETYEILVQMIEGKFNIPVTERTAKQNSARVRFWRNKDKLSLEGGLLCFEGNTIVKKSAMKEVVKNPDEEKYTTDLKTVIVASQSGLFTKCCLNQLFTRNSMLALKIGHGFVRFTHEMFRYDIKST